MESQRTRPTAIRGLVQNSHTRLPGWPAHGACGVSVCRRRAGCPCWRLQRGADHRDIYYSTKSYATTCRALRNSSAGASAMPSAVSIPTCRSIRAGLAGRHRAPHRPLVQSRAAFTQAPSRHFSHYLRKIDGIYEAVCWCFANEFRGGAGRRGPLESLPVLRLQRRSGSSSGLRMMPRR